MTDSSFDSGTWLNLYIALSNLDQVYGKVIEGLDLTIIEVYVLWALDEQDGQRVIDLCNAIGRIPTSFTPILDRVVANKLVERRMNPSDRRSILIYLTPSGHKLSQELVSLFKAIDMTISESISTDQLAGFLAVVQSLQNIKLNGKMPSVIPQR